MYKHTGLLVTSSIEYIQNKRSSKQLIESKRNKNQIINFHKKETSTPSHMQGVTLRQTEQYRSVYFGLLGKPLRGGEKSPL